MHPTSTVDVASRSDEGRPSAVSSVVRFLAFAGVFLTCLFALGAYVLASRLGLEGLPLVLVPVAVLAVGVGLAVIVARSFAARSQGVASTLAITEDGVRVGRGAAEETVPFAKIERVDSLGEALVLGVEGEDSRTVRLRGRSLEQMRALVAQIKESRAASAKSRRS